MTKESERNVTDFITELKHVKSRVDNMLRFISDVQSDTYKKEWEISVPISEEECLFDDRERIADRLVGIYNDVEYVIGNLRGSLEGIER